MKYITIIDNVGRTLIAELISNENSNFVVKNPAMIHAGQTNTGQIQVQLLPLFFPEFIKAEKREEGSTWNITAVAHSDVEVDPKLVEQYTRIFNPSPIITNVPAEAPIVKLFD